jgi:hypothetical protein
VRLTFFGCAARFVYGLLVTVRLAVTRNTNADSSRAAATVKRRSKIIEI